MESTKPKPFCFVLMPFDSSFDDIYKLGIKDACNTAGAYCERVDEQIFQERILDRIFNQIVKADIVIADMTNKNPNVFYEVGYAHAIGKTTILLTQNSDDIPFDLKHFPHIVYNNRIVDLKNELTKRVYFYLENPSVKIEEKLSIEVYSGELNLSAKNAELKGEKRGPNERGLTLNLTFYNNSTLSFKAGDFRVGIIFSKNFQQVWNAKSRGVEEIKLPDNKTLCMLPYFETLFPSAFIGFQLYVLFDGNLEEDAAIVRVFSSVGTRDYFVNIKF